MNSECTLTVCAKLCQIAQGWVTICPCVLHPPNCPHQLFIFFYRQRGPYPGGNNGKHISRNDCSSGIPRPPLPPSQGWGRSLPGGNPPEKQNLSNIEMGGRGAGTLVGDQRCLRLEDYESDPSNGFPLIPPGYGHQNVQAYIFYNTVVVRGYCKQRPVKHTPDMALPKQRH